MVGCVVCGGQLDDLALRLDLTFHPGSLGPDTAIAVPHRATEIGVCYADWKANPVVRMVLSSGELSALPSSRGCRVECSGHRRGRLARFWSPFRGARGVPAVGKCPVCWGPIEIPQEVA